MYSQIPESQALLLSAIAVFLGYAWAKTSNRQFFKKRTQQ